MLSKNKVPYLTFGIGLTMIFGLFYTLNFKALAEDYFILEEISKLQIIGETTLLPVAAPPSHIVKKTIKVMVTGYSSSIEETDETPFITASNTEVRGGIVANNLLSFGTRVRLPEIFGDKILEVQDRMSERKGFYHVDIWFPTKEQALEFGAQIATMEILEG